MKNPNAYFESLTVFCAEDSISNDQKIEILCQWEYDARELAVAEEEGMSGGPPDKLHEILEALRQLGINSDPEYSSPTKQHRYN